MSLVNPNIALSTRGVELQDPLAQYGRVMAIQQAGNQNALAQYQLGAAQRGEARDIARTNALAGAGSDETAVANALLKSGDIPAYSAFVKAIEDRKTQRLMQQKTQGEISAQPLAMQKAENELFDTSMKQIRNSWGSVRTPEDAMAIHDATHRDPVINKRLQAFGITEQMGRQQIIDAAQDPARFAAFVKKAQLSAKEFMEMNKPVTSVGPTGIVQTPGLGGAATIVPGTSAAFQMTPAQIAANKIAQQQLGVSQGQLSLAQQRLAQDAQGVTYQQDAQGNLVALPSRLAAGGAPVARPVTGEGGAPVKGKLSPFAEKAQAQRTQMGKDLDFAIKELGDITKDGGLIDQSTGSGAGRLVDIGAGFVGQATKGAIAIGKIAPVSDLALKMVPRFEGPQSDRDTASYKEAAGQLADPTLPTKIRKEAGKTVLRLMQQRKGQFATNDMAAEGVGPAPAASGVIDFGSLR